MKLNAKFKFLSVILAALMLFSALPTAALAATTELCSDIHETDWFYEDINYVLNNHLMLGTGNGAFSPQQSPSRGMIVAILHRMEGEPMVEGAQFADVVSTQYYAPAILWAAANKIVEGYGDNNFGPDDSITREQMATIIYRYAKYKGFDVSDTVDISGFADAAEVSGYAKDAVSWANAIGLVGGTGNNCLSPKGNATRAQAAAVLHRFCEKYDVAAHNSCEVTFDYNYEDKGTYATMVVDAGSKVSSPDNPSRSGYSFSGWFDMPTGGRKFDFDVQIDRSITLYARWTWISGGAYIPPAPPSYDDLTIFEEGEVSAGTYQNVTVAESVGDGDVTLSHLNIRGDLIINGGGSNYLHLVNCIIGGKIIVNKVGGEVPRIHLSNTHVDKVEAQQPMILEAADSTSAVAAVEAKAPLEVRGADTAIGKITVPENVGALVEIIVTEGNVAEVEANSEIMVGGAGGTVASVIATAPVTVDSAVVDQVEIPADAENVAVDVRGNGSIEITTDSDSTTISAENADSVTVSGEAKDDIAVHEHIWDAGTITEAATCVQEGVKTCSCTVDDCQATKTETIAKLAHTEAVDEAVPATCTDTGLTEGKHCAVCDAVIAEQQIIDALGHDFTGAYTNDETGHWHKCSRCDATDTKAAHTYNTTNCAEAAICTVCGYEKVAGQHTWNTGVVTTEPTCTEAGTRSFTCTACNDTKTEPIDATGHTEVTDPAVPATCTEAGKTEGKHCSVCNAVITAQQAVDALGHDLVDDSAVAATCTAAGTEAGKYCVRCDYTEGGAVVAALGHDFTGAYSKDESGHWHKCSRCDATDAKAGHTYPAHTCDAAAACSVCGYEKAAGAHTWNAGIVTTEPTCTEKGVKTYTCTICNATKTEDVAALGHDLVHHEAKAATCTEIGWSAYDTCSRCDYTTYAEIAAKGHTPVVDHAVEPTCTEAGKTEGKHCSVCNAVITAQQTVAALGHDFTGAYSSDANGHWHKCSRCDATDAKAGHTYPDHNCDAAATCSVCGYEKAAGAHTWNAGIVTTEPTCTEKGVKTYTCTICNATKTEDVAAPNHDIVSHEAKVATCTEKGWNAYDTCSRCDYTTYAEIDALGHTPMVDNAQAATCTEAGKTEGSHCSVCNAVITAQQTVVALGHDFTGEYLNDAEGHWHKCSRCDATDTKTSHNYPDHTCDQAATCTVCGYEKTAGAHTWNSSEVTTLPTCTEKGVKTFVCTVCGATKTEDVDVLNHDIVSHEAKAATCTEKGWNTYDTCSRCDYTTYAEIPATGHTFDQKNTDAKYLVPGTEDTYYYSCKCGETGETIFEAEYTEPTFVVGNVIGKPGDVVIVPIVVRNNPGIFGMTLVVSFDESVVTLTSAANGTAMGSAFTLTKPKKLKDGCKFLWDAMEITDEDVNDGEMLLLTFTISETASDGSSDVIVSYTPGDVYGTDTIHDIFELVCKKGSITVKSNKVSG